MKIHVRYFAQLREQLARGEDLLTLSGPATPADLLNLLFVDSVERHKMGTFLRVAINGTYESLSSPLQDGDEVVFIPPVAGG